ncbi:MAG: helix-turn-helix domain-containing protein [Candidatus Brocadiaceae bacterium]|nr:helix-turn-helix domain-containing protein [Candidatus Brocadiaceae bacterium]
MILLSETGTPVNQIAEELNTYPNKIIYWRQRYIMHRIDGLEDKHRSGRPPIYDETFRNTVLKLLSNLPPKGLAHWDGPALAKELVCQLMPYG